MRLGLCCISLYLQEKGHKFQTMTFSRFSALPRQQALEVLSGRILNNFLVTEKIIRYCKASGFSSYRLSSDLTPIINHPSVNLKLQDLPNASLLFESLSSISKAVKETGLKISAHPSEYISLTSPKEEVISNSTRDLSSHAELFDLIGLPQSYDAPLNIHCRQDGDPEAVSSSFLKNFDKLPDNVKNRLVLEVNDNKEGVWSIKNLHKFIIRELTFLLLLITCIIPFAIITFLSAKLWIWLTRLGKQLLYSIIAKASKALGNTPITQPDFLGPMIQIFFGMLN